MASGTEKDMLERIERRIHHLDARIAKAKAEGRSLSYDEAECSAHKWAVKTLRALLQVEA